MKTFYSKLGRWLLMTLFFGLSAAAVSCGDDDGGGDSKVASVTVNAVEATENALVVLLTPANCEALYCKCISAGEAIPSAEELSIAGVKVPTPDVPTTARFKDLLANAEYTIVAAGWNAATGYSQVASVSMQTGIPVPQLILTAGTSTSRSLTFTLEPIDVSRVAYVCVKASDKIPSASEILASGTQVDAANKGEYTVSGLQTETDYKIVAAAMDIADANSVVSMPLEMETRPIEQPRVGDFYYSDGTWSTELDASKTPIGVVFYLGAATRFNDKAIFYKLKDGKTPMNSIRGYVVALNNANVVEGVEQHDAYWHRKMDGGWDYNFPCTCSTETEDFLGYSNTQSIKILCQQRYGGALSTKDGNFPAFYYAVDHYESVCPAPETSSGWFLPSVHQLMYLQSVWFNEQGIASIWPERSFELLGDKATSVIGYEYWTSTEHTQSDGTSYRAYYACLDPSYANYPFGAYYQKNTSFAVRSILVF